MSILRIFNCSEYIHAGAAPKTQNSFTKNPVYYSGVREMPDGSYGAAYLPTGGLSFMLNPILEHLASTSKVLKKDNDDDKNVQEETLVFCVDDTPTIKREMYKNILKDETGYKATRNRKSIDIQIQRDATRDILSLVSNNVLFCDGYEADDIIYSLVLKYKNEYDEIIIHTRDSDMYSLVQDKVSISTVGTQGKVINLDNFSSSIKGHDNRPMPYNKVLLDKLYFGDKSDNIPGIGGEMISVIESYIKPSDYFRLTNTSLLRTLVRKASKNNPVVLGILDLLIPLRVDDEIITLYEDSLNIERLCFLANRISNKYMKKDVWKKEDFPEVTELLDYYTNQYYMKGGRCSG